MKKKRTSGLLASPGSETGVLVCMAKDVAGPVRDGSVNPGVSQKRYAVPRSFVLV